MKQEHSKVFYGWWVVGACCFVALYTSGVVVFGFTAVFEPIADEFGWSYAQISLAASLRGLETGLLAPIMGLLVDRWGPRRLIFAGAIVAGLGLIVLSLTNSLGVFYLAFVLIALGMSTCSQTVMLTAIVNWFRRKVAIATGITVSGFAAGGIMVPLIAILIDAFQWRMAMVVLGIGVWVIALPLSLLIRHKPEKYGYLPDGDATSTFVTQEGLTSMQSAGIDVQPNQALRSRAFWHIAVAFMIQFMLTNAVATHVMPYLSTVGIARSAAGLVASAVPLVSIAGRLGFSWLGGRLGNRRMAAVGCALSSLGLLFFEYASSRGVWLLVLFVIVFGIAWGIGIVMRVALVRECFGTSKFGTIHGFTVGVMMLGNITGPPLAGWVFDTWGSYQGIWLSFAVLSILALVIVLTTPRAGRTS